ncbi:RHS repeat-associated core domain-containing protein [Dactylosporangium sp. CA-152071]|uniref:RHS repeat domain-containing protein n=1 Tax=Dactylosporangium sp. CA-152071 TaxID=3239933 RepID=UPI003D9469C9
MRARWVGLVALAVTLLADGVAVIPANAGPVDLKLPKDQPLVQGRDAVFKAPAKDPQPTVTAAPKVAWPAAGTAEVQLPVAASLQATAAPALAWAQGLPVGARAGAALGPQQRLSGESLGTVPGKVRVSLLAHGTGGRDVVLRVGRSDGRTGAGAVVVGVDYTAFRDAYGADWSRRLRLVALPECALSTPSLPGCQEQALDSTNDPVTGVVSAAVAAPALLDQRLDATTVAAPQARSGMLVALAAGPDSDGGDFKATDLNAANKWGAGGSAGGFNWSYPVPLPPGAGGPMPQVQLGYSSQSVDGMTAAANSQPSWVGEGFNWQPGSIERGYRGCTDDGRTGTGDVCWVGENATMTLNGQSSTLVLENGKWRPSADNGAKVEKLANLATGNGDDDGEYWRVTTTDGTEYYFGLNRLPGWDGDPATETKSVGYEPVYGNNTGEPCNANGWCQQAYRWNLDYVVDPFKNTMSYFYERHLNNYARNRTDSAGTPYVRDLYVREINYGTRQNAAGADTVFAGTAPARVLFGAEERCITPGATCVPVAANAANFPDAPVDQLCSGTSCAGRYSPTFFTTKRLSTVTTEVATGNRTWRRVTQTKLSHQWNDPGVNLQKVLWLSSIKGCGTTDDADACTPPVQLNPVGMRNRVDMAGTTNSITRYRMRSILTESGNTIAVTYSAEDCVAGQTMPAAPDNNNRRCYPQYWVPPGTSSPKLEYFHKYRVEKVAEGDGGDATDGTEDEETTYEYIGDPAWHSDQNPIAMPNRRTWGLWRGYQKVRVLRGAATSVRLKTETTYFRGMHGDKLSSGTRTASVPDSDGGSWADEDRFAGTVREQINYLGETSTVVDKTKTDPYEYGPTATQDVLGITVRAWVTNVKATQVTTTLDGGRAPRKTRTTNTFLADGTGRVERVDDEADLSTTADDQCVRQWYASNAAGTNIQHLSRVEVVAVRCALTPNRVTDVVSDVRMWYDGATSYSTTLTKGFTSRVEQLLTPNATNPTYQTTTRAAADEHGRSVDVWDAENYHTGTAYTPATGGPVTKVSVTNPLGWVTDTDVDPASGRAISVVDKDVSGPGTTRRTDFAYDKLSRVVSVWAPGRNKAANETASVKFAYDLRQTGASSVATSRLNTTGNGYLTSYSLLDSKLRPRQEQTPAEGGNRVIAETLYDSRGLAKVSRPAFGATGAPSGTLRLATDTEVPGQTRSTYDGAGRLILQAWQLSGVTQWTGSHAYGGDREDLSPPAGSSATSTFIDARGRITALWTYRGNVADPVNGAHDVMRRTYHPNGEVASVTDGSGNLWTYVVDAMGRVTEANDPDTGKSTYGYDLLGKVTKTVSARNVTMYTTYDGLGRRTAEYTGTTTNKTAEWTYDTLVHGQPTAATRYQGGQAYTRQVTEYTAAGQPKKTKVTIPSNTTTGTLAGDYVTESTYNADGTVATATASAKVSVPNYGGLNDETLQLGYTALGNPLTLQSNLGTYVVDTQYKPEGMLGSMQLRDSAAGKNLRQLWSYYPGSKLLSNHLVYGDIPNTVAKNATYTYDASGNVLSIADRIAQYSAGQDDVQCFRYDDRFRLSDAWTPTSGNCATAPTVAGLGGAAAYWKSYTSDASGNRTSEVTHTAGGDFNRTYTYPAQGVGTGRPHAVTQIATTGAGTGTDTYGYDNGGNVTTRSIAGRPSQTLTWTPANQLESVSDSTGTTSYLYDADGARLLTKDPAGTTLHLGDVEYRLAGGATSGTRSYVHAGQTIAVRTPQGLSWQCADHQGTAGLSFKATDLSKTVRRADPFGNPRGPVVTWPSKRGFLNGYADDTGLVHLGAREYDPRAGRFVSVDPILDANKLQGMNGYSYAENSPVTLSDPDGRYACRGNECAPNPPAAAPPAPEDPPVIVIIVDKGGDPKKPTGKTVLKYKGKVWLYHNCKEGMMGPVTVSPCAPEEELGVAVPCSNGGGGGLKGEICWESTDGFRHDLYGNKYCPLKAVQTACSPGSATPKQERVCQNYSTVMGPKQPKYQGGQYEDPFECSSGKEVCRVGNILNFVQFLTGFCPILWCTAVGAGIGAVSAGAYYLGGETDKGNRQLATTALGLAVGPLTGRVAAKVAFGAEPSVQKGLDYSFGQVGGYAAGVSWCGWTPFGCDDEATFSQVWPFD